MLRSNYKGVSGFVIVAIVGLMAAVSFLSLPFYILYIAIYMLAFLQLLTDASVEASRSSSDERVLKRFVWKVIKAFPIFFVFMLVIMDGELGRGAGEDSDTFFLLGTLVVSFVFARLRKNPTHYQDPDPLRESQVRLASLLLAIALVFFATLFGVGHLFSS